MAGIRCSLRLILALAFALTLALCGSAWARPRLTVRAFENKTTERHVPASAITDMMVTELSKAGIFNLLEREKLDYIADEIRLGQSGLMDSETAPELGRIKGAQYTMTGAVTLYHYNAKGGGGVLPGVGGVAAAKTAYVTLDIRIIDNTTGEIVYAADRQGSSKREIAGLGVAFPGFMAGGVNVNYGGILASATREAVIAHVKEMKEYDWE